MLTLLFVGALTSNVAKYSYRLWEFEQMELYDPFDVSGSSIVYYIYNNIIVKTSSIISDAVSWCSDKVRNFTDNFSSSIYAFPLVAVYGFKCFISTWSEHCIYLLEVLFVMSLYCYVSNWRSDNVLLYDSYTSSLELWFFLQFSKFKNINIINFKVVCNCILRIDLYVMQVLLLGFFYDLTFFCSFLNLNYPYLWICLLKYFNAIYIIGVLCSVMHIFLHKYLGFLFMFSILDCMYSYRLYYLPIHFIDGFLLQQSLGISSVCDVLCISIKIFSFIILLKGFYYYYDSYEYLTFHYYSILSLIILPPYSIFFFEFLFNMYYFSQYFSFSYVCFECDIYNINIPCKMLFLLSYYSVVSSTFYDFILPLCSFVNHFSINLDYYGNLGVHMPLVKQFISFNIHQYISFINLLLFIPFNSYHSYELYINCSSYSFYVHNYFLNVLLILFLCYIYLFFNLSVNFKYVYLFYFLKFCNIYYTSCIYSVGLFLYLFRNCNYVDYSTYFLTGTYCKLSAFMARHRYIIGMGYSF